ncbi:MAG: hypothetical protein AAGD11_06840 [Planctomycetota bacterium]
MSCLLNFQLVRLRRLSRRNFAAILAGLSNTAGEAAALIDANGSYDFQLIEQMVSLLVPGTEMVTASPYHPDGTVENVSAWRIWLS